MKQERGVTLTSVAIYIIGLIVVMGMISSYSGYFFGNADDIVSKNNAEEEYMRFLTYFTKDLNSEELKDVSFYDAEDSVGNNLSFTFSNGEIHNYFFNDKKIFYKQIQNDTTTKVITLCSQVNIDEHIFRYENSQIMLHFYIEGENFTNTFYVNIQ